MTFDCGEREWPGRDEAPGWRDWSQRETTYDQLRIEAHLEGQPIEGASILHIGCGNSSLARRFAARAGRIDGITIAEGEKALADSLRLPRYRVFLLNKYNDLTTLPGGYDFVVDNNPSTFACCRFHLDQLFEQSFALLSPKGVYLTDTLGLGWVGTNGDPALAMTFEDLAAAGARFGFAARRETDFVCSLRRAA